MSTIEANIECPKCKAKIPLSEALSKEIEAKVKKEYQADAKKQLDDLKAAHEDEMKAAKDKTDKDRATLETRLRREIADASSTEMKDLQKALDDAKISLQTAQDNELQLRQQKRDLEEREKNLKLEVERTLDRERGAIAEKAAQDSESAHRLRDAEKDTKLAKVLEQLEEAQRKLQQGSQQAQGEALELELETALKTEFPFDLISEVSKGVKGGDIQQWVRMKSGTDCGMILWELKRTKNFSEGWLTKLKTDGRNCKADLCLLVTETLPDGIKTFGEMDGVWVSSISSAMALAHVLREVLMRVAREKGIQTGKKDKAELVYEYLTGTEFKGRLEAIVEVFKTMSEDLESEKRAFEKIWARRYKQIGQVLNNLAGMHGDLEGLAGNEIPSITLLELPSPNGKEKK